MGKKDLSWQRGTQSRPLRTTDFPRNASAPGLEAEGGKLDGWMDWMDGRSFFRASFDSIMMNLATFETVEMVDYYESASGSHSQKLEGFVHMGTP